MTQELLNEVLFVKETIAAAVFRNQEDFPRDDWELLVYGSCLNGLFDNESSDIDMTLIAQHPDRYPNQM
jgi:hypothetical protein